MKNLARRGDQSAGRAVAAIRNALADGDEVRLVGFGTFSVRERAARMGRNPATGEAIKIAASCAPAFKASGALKSAIR